MKAIFVYVLLGFATLALAQSEMNLSQIKMNLQNTDEALKVSAVKSLMQEVNSRTRSQGSSPNKSPKKDLKLLKLFL